jgi:hypothetical protein
MTPSQMQATVGEDDVEDMPDALLDAIEGAQGKRGEAA